MNLHNQNTAAAIFLGTKDSEWSEINYILLNTPKPPKDIKNPGRPLWVCGHRL
jgi:hypothetical protein